jgi:hypothetical protein
MELNEREAFIAMSRFLYEYAARGEGYDLADLMGSIFLERDGSTTDPAQWTDWTRCVRAVKNGEGTPLSR